MANLRIINDFGPYEPDPDDLLLYRKQVTYKSRVFKLDEGAWKAVVQLERPDEWDKGYECSTKAAAQRLCKAMLDELNEPKELERRFTALVQTERREQFAADAEHANMIKIIEQDLSAALKRSGKGFVIDVGDTVIFQSHDTTRPNWVRPKTVWVTLRCEEDGLHIDMQDTSKSESILFARDRSLGPIKTLYANGKSSVVRKGGRAW